MPERFHYICCPNNPYPTIQEAIDTAYPSWIDTILVDTGTYYENIDFKGKNVTVASKLHLFPGHTEYIDQTIIDGSAPADSDYASVARFLSGESPCATLKGFTIKNGAGTALYFPGKDKLCRFGGGVCCKGSSPTIRDNILISNSATDGGGIVCQNSSAQIFHNLIKENLASECGGRIAVETEEQCYSVPIISNNLILDNEAVYRGGGIYYAGDPFIINNTIDGNSVTPGVGGGIYVQLPDSGCIQNNIISNSLDGEGIAGSAPEVIAYNDAYNNAGGDFETSGPEGVGDTTWGENPNGTPCDCFFNIIRDPEFYDGYHLSAGSACIDAGDNQAPYLLPTDFEGNHRVVDGDENGSYFVDMGAYEYHGGSCAGGGGKVAAGGTTAENKSATGVPKTFELLQNYPNPFNPVTHIQFAVASDQSPAHVTLKIYNLCGQLVRVLVDEEKASGKYTVAWDGRSDSGKEVASGIYFYQIRSSDLTYTKRMVLIK